MGCKASSPLPCPHPLLPLSVLLQFLQQPASSLTFRCAQPSAWNAPPSAFQGHSWSPEDQIHCLLNAPPVPHTCPSTPQTPHDITFLARLVLLHVASQRAVTYLGPAPGTMSARSGHPGACTERQELRPVQSRAWQEQWCGSVHTRPICSH